jgi:hypothetical protein
MPDEPIPDDVRDFILRHIDSIAQIEALLLLRDNPTKIWDIPAATKRLYISNQEAAHVLTRLCQDGLVDAKEGVYSYHCPDAEIRAVIDRLADAYARHLIPVTNMIHSKPTRIRQFSDAFKFRRNS